MPTKVTQQTAQAFWQNTGPDVDGNPVTTNRFGPVFSWNDTKSGVTLPSWKDKLRNGQNATTPYSVTGRKVRFQNGYSVMNRKTPIHGNLKLNQFITQGQFCPRIDPSGTVGGWEQNAIDVATFAFLKKAKKAQTLFDGGVFLGELKEALHGVAHPAEAIKDLLTRTLYSYDSLRRRRYRNRMAFRSAIRQTWLEAQFHWLPLISDAQSAAEAFAEAAIKSRKENQYVQHKLSFDTETGLPTLNDTYVPTGSAIIHRLTSSEKLTSAVKICGGVRANTFAQPGFDARLWGLAPRDFIPTIWELVPWSWAVDYFSNVGNVLTAWSYGLSDLNWTSKTVKRTFTRKAVLNYNEAANANLSNYVSGYGSAAVTESSTFLLSRGSDIAIPSFKWDFHFPGWKKVANLASVLTLKLRVSSNLSNFDRAFGGRNT